MIYENSTDEMAISIDGKYRIQEITRESFAKETKNIGMGSKMAMKRFDEMAASLKKALLQAKENLEAQGFAGIQPICTEILSKGGVRNYI